ncbi:hypothetical protein [Actinoplanes sp. HUAS TT8]|uniref:hypothetical protein n=1 Tax=Actinoplanes sp. HUAS TT8 TaxID=3447453 RepID=UPI003F51DA7B
MGPDVPERLLAAVERVMPAGRRAWGRAMRAELAAIDRPADRLGFAWGCARAAAAQFHLLRGVIHLAVVLGALGAVLAWVVALGYPPLIAVLGPAVTVLAVVTWTARRTGMLGPAGDSAGAWLLRASGYLLAGAITVTGLAHRHPATPEAADSGAGILVFSIIGAGLLLAAAMLASRRSAATARVLIAGTGSGLAGAVIWVLAVLVAPPIPASTGWALAVAGIAGVTALAAGRGRTGTTAGALLSVLLAVAVTLVSIFVAVVLLAHLGPDSVIPDITPFALDGQHIAESRVEIVDPYILVVVLGGLAATALGAAGVLTRRTSQ